MHLRRIFPISKKPFISTSPENLNDGIPVGTLGVDGGDKASIVKFAKEIAAGQHGEIDSLLLYHHGKLLFESTIGGDASITPHYQMSITKSYTALAIGRAIQSGYLTMADLDKPVVSFLKDLDQSKLVPGATSITLAEAMNMKSGIRIKTNVIRKLMQKPDTLTGQRQVQAYLEHSAPIPETNRTFKYQSSDPSLTMQVLEAVVPGSHESSSKPNYSISWVSPTSPGRRMSVVCPSRQRAAACVRAI